MSFYRGTANLLMVIMALGLPTGRAPGDDGPLKLGMSTALTGPAAQLGINVRDGVIAAIEEVNRSGGIQGKLLRLICLDDGYEPARTAPNMKALIDDHQVLAIVGNVGTPTAVAAIPIVNEKQTVLFGAYSGAGILRREPPDRYVINYRASYAEETAAMVDALIEKAGLTVNEIAFFTQRDAYGDAGYVGGVAALKRHGLLAESEITHGRYERNTDAVENALADIVGSRTPVRAVIMVGAYAPCATFIRMAKEIELDALYLNVSFVGTHPLIDALGDDGDGVIVTQVVPHVDAPLPIVSEYHAALSALQEVPVPTFGSLEGYIVGRILNRALKSIPGQPTRTAVVDALETLGEFDMGLGNPLSLSRKDHQASNAVFPTVIRNRAVIPFDWVELQHER